MSAWLVALAAGFAVALGMPRPPRPPDRSSPAAAEGPSLARLRGLLVLLAALGTWTILEGTVGVLAGLAVAVLSWRALDGAESPAARRRRLALERDLPVAVHLLGACLAAGTATTVALDTVADALGGAVGAELRTVRARLQLGADPVTVWRDVARSGPLARLGRPLARAHESGAPVTAVIAGLSEDLHAEAEARRRTRARAVEVRATAPIGVCLLPAFLLLGVVPLTVGVFGSLELFA